MADLSPMPGFVRVVSPGGNEFYANPSLSPAELADSMADVDFMMAQPEPPEPDYDEDPDADGYGWERAALRSLPY